MHGLTRGFRSRNRRHEAAGEEGRVGVPVLLAIVFLLGVAVSAFWFYGRARAHRAETQERAAVDQASGLSEGTRSILGRLNSPVEIRYYSLLDAEAASQSLVAYAGRVGQLLGKFQREGHGMIKLVRYDSFSPDIANKALADGIKPFNLDQGNGCYLGVAIAAEDRRDALPQLSPQWEAALESDLSRAIERVSQPKATPAQTANPSRTNSPAMVEEIKRAIPDMSAVSVEEGTRILQEAALKDFQAAVKEMSAKVHEAEERVKAAQNQTEAEQQAALLNLEQVQAEQTRKLQEIAAQSQAQIQAFKQLKADER